MRASSEPAPRNTVGLLTLALGAFVVGTAELVIVGVLNRIASDLAVSVSTSGQLVTAYAAGVCVGGPALTALTTRLNRRLLLLATLAAYVAGNALSAISVGFGQLLISRVLTGSVHGLLIGVACSVAAGLVPPARRGRAISMVLSGIAVSIVVGVPLGTLVGQTLGWRATFGAVIVLGAVAWAATLVLVRPAETVATAGLSSQARAALAPRVQAVLAVGLLFIGAQFTAFTYLAAYLQRVTGVSGGTVSAFLLAYGIATAIGSSLGGRAADRNAGATLSGANLLLVPILGLLYLVGSSGGLVAVTLGLWGVVGFGAVPALQLRVISLAGPGGDLAATLGVSAVNAGIAGGSLIGGWAVSAYGIHSVALLATILCAATLPATWASGRLGTPADLGQVAAPVPVAADEFAR